MQLVMTSVIILAALANVFVSRSYIFREKNDKTEMKMSSLIVKKPLELYKMYPVG
jgi:hypothetical protein